MHIETIRKGAMERNNIAHVLRGLRLALSGAIVGAALAGIFSPLFGFRADDLAVDLVGAIFGFVAVAGVKAAHLI
jgi:hypothetical protein